MSRWWTAWAVLLAGCGGEELDGFLWDINLEAVIDDCHPEGEGIPYSDSQQYRMSFDGSYAELALGAETFAAGTITGCNVEYETVVWGQDMGDGTTIRWQLFGEASWRQGGGCDSAFDDKSLDWEGTETYVIMGYDPPDLDIPVGCEYVVETTGSFVGQAG